MSSTSVRLLLRLVVVSALLALPAVAERPPLRGRSLEEALEALRDEGLDLAWSSELVRPEMRVDEEPRSAEARAALDEILAPHELAAEEGPRGRILVVRAPSRPRDDGAGRGETAGARPAVVDTVRESIDVSAKSSLLRDAPPSASALDRGDILDLPHFGDDLYRAIALLPGVATGDIAGNFSVRGGLHREILVELDGQELFEPFHLKDFQGIFSIVDPQVVASVDLVPAAFPVRYGDRSSALLAITSSAPASRTLGFGISLSNAWASGGGGFAGDRGDWLASLRRGYLDFVLAAENPEEDDLSPRYWDSFVRTSWQLSPRHRASARLLAAGDDLTFRERDAGETADVETSWGNLYAWIDHDAVIGDGSVSTALSLGRLDREREIHTVDGRERFALSEERTLDVASLRQDWSFALGRQKVELGFEGRRYEADFDYVNEAVLAGRIDDPRFFAVPTRIVVDRRLESDVYAAYVSDLIPLGGRVLLEPGLRWDRQSSPAESHSPRPAASQVSPRLNAVVDLGRAGLLRLGWGRFHQSQRPYELDLQFGETALHPAERSRHWTAGWEKSAGRLSWRADAYHRVIDDPRPRYEALFEPFSPFPELAPDLVRFDAAETTARGLEIYVRHRPGRRFGGWVSYALASVEDEIDGRDLPRSFDQRHALVAGGSWTLGPKWSLHAVFTYHTGWPTTALAGSATVGPDGRVVIDHEVGPFQARRHPAYHRLDVRATRSRPLRRGGRFTFFVDVQNLYDRENLRGYNVDDEEVFRDPGGELRVVFPEEYWLGIIPSLGVSWEL